MSLSRSLVLALCLILVPASAVADGEDTDDPPFIMDGTLTPNSVGYEGGVVVIAATVTDDVGVSDVYADVVKLDGSNTSMHVPMTSDGSSTYSGSVTIPANFTTDQASWQVSIWATDTMQQGYGYADGEIDQAPQPQFDEHPLVWDPQVSPRTLAASGGQVSITAAASDDRSVMEVHAVITHPDGSATDVPLDAFSQGRFAGVFKAPVNPSTMQRQYGITVVVTDDIGQQGVIAGGIVTVAAPASPSTGRLVALPSRISFSSVPVGTTVRRSIVLMHLGPRSATPIQVAIGALGAPAPFSLVGGARSVTLKRGQAVILRVTFKPSSVGSNNGFVQFVRLDGQQKRLFVALSGRGVKGSTPSD